MNYQKIIHFITTSVLLLGISACTTVELKKQNILTNLTPEVWEQQQNEIAKTPFGWNDFNDKKLTELLDIALTNSPSIYSSVLAIQSATLSTQEQESSSGVNYSIDTRSGVSKARNFDTQESYGLTAKASYEIDFWDKKADKLAIEELNLLSNQIRLKTARIILASSVAETYFTIRLQDKQLEFHRSTLIELTRQKDMLLARQKAGLITSLEINNQDVEIQSIKARIEDSEGQRIIFELILGNLLGLPPHEFNLAPDENFSFPIQLLVAETPSQVLRHRPDIQLAEATLQSSNRNFYLTKKSLYPNINLTTSAGYASNSLSALLKNNALSWFIGADVIYTLLDTGTKERKIKQAKINAEKQVNNYRQAILNALKDVESALAAQASGARQAKIAKLKLSAQQRLTFETQERYKYGSVSAFDVSIQKRLLIAQQESMMQQQLANVKYSISLIKALGIEP